MKTFYFIVFFITCYSLQSNAQGTSLFHLPAGLNEVSGIALGHSKKIFAFVHNDSGDTSRFFGINKKGALACTFYFNGKSERHGVSDCEDIASGKSATGEKKYLYLGDIGDNGARKSHITIYRFPEPRSSKKKNKTVTGSAVFFKYPDGARDAEALMIDNADRLLYIVSKREDTVRIYSSPLTWNENDTVTLQYRAQLYLPGTRPAKWITSGDISWDGNRILLKTLQQVYYWERGVNEAIWQTLQKQPAILPYQKEPQGEAICFDAKGKGFYTVSEGEEQPVYYYQITQ